MRRWSLAWQRWTPRDPICRARARSRFSSRRPTGPGWTRAGSSCPTRFPLACPSCIAQGGPIGVNIKRIKERIVDVPNQQWTLPRLVRIGNRLRCASPLLPLWKTEAKKKKTETFHLYWTLRLKHIYFCFPHPNTEHGAEYLLLPDEGVQRWVHNDCGWNEISVSQMLHQSSVSPVGKVVACSFGVVDDTLQRKKKEIMNIIRWDIFICIFNSSR